MLAGLDANALGGQDLDSVANHLAKAPNVETLEKWLRPYRESYKLIQRNLDQMSN
jgi:hypothetical protein